MLVVEVFIQGSREEAVFVVGLHAGLEGGVELDFDEFVLKHVGDKLGIAAHGEALVLIKVVVIIVGEADGDALDDVGRELLRADAPLLGAVVAEEGFIHLLTDEAQQLLLGILGMGDALVLLAFDEGARFGWVEGGAEELVDGVQVDGHAEDAFGVFSLDAVDPWCPLVKAVDEVPDALVAGVEDVGAKAVNIDSCLFIAGGVAHACYLFAPINDGGGDASICKLSGNDAAREPSAYNKNTFHTPIPYHLLRKKQGGNCPAAHLATKKATCCWSMSLVEN